MIETPGHVVITGAAGAIGAALARAMRAAWPGVRLALVDRDEEPLRALANELGAANGNGAADGKAAANHGGAADGRSTATRVDTASGESVTNGPGPANGNGAANGRDAVTVHVADLRNLDALPDLVASIERGGATPSKRGATDSGMRPLPIDGLVNCAGVMRVQQVSTWRWDDAYSLLAINLLAPLRLQDLVVRGMVDRGRGLLVNVASMAGRVPLRGCAYYGAAKAGLAMASEIARADLAGRGVRVVTVYPGPVKSALEAGARADYGGGGLFGRLAPTGDPRELAARIMHAIAEDEPRVIYPRLYGLGWTAPNLSSWLTLSYGPPPVS